MKVHRSMRRNAHFRMVGEEHDMKVAFSLKESAKEFLHDIGCMEQLKAFDEVEHWVGEGVKKQRVSLYDEKFVTRVVSDEIHRTGEQTVIPTEIYISRRTQRRLEFVRPKDLPLFQILRLEHLGAA